MAEQQSSQVYHALIFKFIGEDRAGDVLKTVQAQQKLQGIKVVAWAIAAMDDKGKVKIKQGNEAKPVAGAGAIIGGVIAILGGPIGLIASLIAGGLIGGVAGRFMGHKFQKEDLEKLSEALTPSTSAIILVLQDTYAQGALNAMGETDATVVDVVLGDETNGELSQLVAVDVGDSALPAEASAAPVADAPAADAPAVEEAPKS
jgi:uncharacterized membrane protein